MYLSKEIAGYFFPAHLANRPSESDVPQHFFRAYYTETATFEVLGQRFEIRPLVSEIVRIHGLLTASSANGGRLPATDGTGD